MRRRTLDVLLTAGGLVVAVVLVAGGGLLVWANSFIGDQIHTQLAAQQIFFPKAGSEGLQDPAVKPYLTQYAGQQLTTGAQAKAYADHFIAVHLKAIGGGKTYSQLSSEAQANPTDTKLAGQVATTFRGETLRGLLLNAYAFGTMGTVALYAAFGAFAAAAVLLVLALLGLRHMRHTPPEAEVLVPRGTTPKVVV